MSYQYYWTCLYKSIRIHALLKFWIWKVLIMGYTYRSVLFQILLYWFLISLAKNEHCVFDGSDDCHVFPWRSWGSCIGVCGHQKQSRERVFCCDANVIPHDIEHCLQHCRFNNDFERLQNKTCRVCENGGTFSSISSSCICGPRYTGGCCQGKTCIQVIIYFVHTFLFDFMKEHCIIQLNLDEIVQGFRRRNLLPRLKANVWNMFDDKSSYTLNSNHFVGIC